MAELLSGVQQKEGRTVQYATGQARSLERREDPEVHEESDELPSLPGPDFGLVELDTAERRAERALDSERAAQTVTVYIVVVLLWLLLVLALVRVLTSSRVTDGGPRELSYLELTKGHGHP